MPKKKDKKSVPDLARECLSNYEEREWDNLNRAKEAIRFRAGQQWPLAIKQDRENPNQDGGPRPCPVMDKTNQYVRQIVNEERQNRAAIRYRPVDDYADKKVAEVLSGIVRHIEDRSQAIEAYTTAGEHAIDGGFGFWRILTEYSDPMSFDQEIVIKRIPNRFSVALGPHMESDGADAQEAVIWEDMPREEFRQKYPKAKEIGWDQGDGWADKDTIRVAEYMRIEQIPETIHLMPDGSTWTDEEIKQFPGSKPLKSRTTTRKVVKWYKVTAQEILEEKEMLGSYIPVVKVVGNELTMPDGKIRYSGVIESMMDPQRVHNFAHAGFIETVALAPRAPWMAEESQVQGYENDYAAANRRNITILKYKGVSTDDGHLLPPPRRETPPGIPSGWQAMLQNTEHGIEGSAGMYGPSVGAKSQEKSGVALREQKVQGMVGNFHFPDNLARSIQHTGRILLEWIPKVYDTERVARILGEDGQPDMVYLNPDQEQAVQPRLNEFGEEIGSIYNLNVGKYDVTVSTGPSYTTKRQESAEQMIQLLQAKPELVNIIGDIAFSNMDFAGADQIADRLKALLPPPIQEMEASQDKKPLDPRTRAAMAQLRQAEQELQARAQQLAEAEQALQMQAQEVGGDKTELEVAKKDLEAQRKIFLAEAKAAKAQMELDKMRIIEQIEEEREKTEEEDIEHETEMQSSLQLTVEALNQSMQQIAEMTKSVTEGLVVNTQALSEIAQKQNQPKQVTLSDGRTIMVEPVPTQ